MFLEACIHDIVLFVHVRRLLRQLIQVLKVTLALVVVGLDQGADPVVSEQAATLINDIVVE